MTTTPLKINPKKFKKFIKEKQKKRAGKPLTPADLKALSKKFKEQKGGFFDYKSIFGRVNDKILREDKIRGKSGPKKRLSAELTEQIVKKIIEMKKKGDEFDIDEIIDIMLEDKGITSRSESEMGRKTEHWPQLPEVKFVLQGEQKTDTSEKDRIQGVEHQQDETQGAEHQQDETQGAEHQQDETQRVEHTVHHRRGSLNDIYLAREKEVDRRKKISDLTTNIFNIKNDYFKDFTNEQFNSMLFPMIRKKLNQQRMQSEEEILPVTPRTPRLSPITRPLSE